MDENCCCFTSLSAFGVVSVVDFHHPHGGMVVSHCVNLHFLSTLDGEHLSIFYRPSVDPIGDVSVQVFRLFLNQVVCFLTVEF